MQEAETAGTGAAEGGGGAVEGGRGVDVDTLQRVRDVPGLVGGMFPFHFAFKF
jgi:hypothetical protein